LLENVLDIKRGASEKNRESIEERKMRQEMGIALEYHSQTVFTAIMGVFGCINFLATKSFLEEFSCFDWSNRGY